MGIKPVLTSLRGILRVLGKQNSLLPLGPVIKCLLTTTLFSLSEEPQIPPKTAAVLTFRVLGFRALVSGTPDFRVSWFPASFSLLRMKFLLFSGCLKMWSNTVFRV